MMVWKLKSFREDAALKMLTYNFLIVYKQSDSED